MFYQILGNHEFRRERFESPLTVKGQVLTKVAADLVSESSQNHIPLKTKISEIDGWKMKFPFKMVPFQGTC